MESLAIINRAMALMIWPKQDPVGKYFIIGDVLPVRVIGVVGNVKEWGLRQPVSLKPIFRSRPHLDPAWGYSLS